jgi:hypothetical protein
MDPPTVTPAMTQAAIDQATAMAQLVGNLPGFESPPGRRMHLQLAMMSLARHRSLLIAMVAVAREGRFEVEGLLLRAIFEQSLYGSICLFGDQADLARLDADWLYWNNDLADKLGLPVDVGKPKRFSVYDRAVRLDELLQARGAPRGGPVDYYRTLFAGESFGSVHAGHASVGRHLLVVDDEDTAVVFDPDERETGSRSLRLGSHLTSILASWICEAAGSDPAPFTEIDAWPGTESYLV